MAASINNIAATFAAAPVLSLSSSSSSLSSTSSSSSSSSSSSNQTTFSLSMSHKSISTSWNPHRSLHRSQKSTLIDIYGPAGPPPLPFRESSTARDLRLTSFPIGEKLPNVTLTCLGSNGRVQRVAVSSLAKGKKLLLVGVAAAFSPNCSQYIKWIQSTKGKSADLIACVAVNDEFVMSAWGQQLGVGEMVMMLSDGRGELAAALGLPIKGDASSGFGVWTNRYCLAAANGTIMTVHVDDSDE